MMILQRLERLLIVENIPEASELIAGVSRILLLAMIAALPFSVALSNILMLIATLFFYFSVFLEKKQIQIRPLALTKISLLWFSWIILGLIYSQAFFPHALSIALKYHPIIMLCLYIPMFTPAVLTLARRILVFSALILIVLIMVQYFGLIEWTRRFGLASLNKSYIETSLFLTLTASVAWYFKHDFLRNYYYLRIAYFLLFMFYLIFICPSRSGYLAFSVLCLSYGFQQRMLGKTIVGLSVALLLALIVSPQLSIRLHELFQNVLQPGSSEFLRFHYAIGSLHAFSEHPWLGTGTGSFAWAYRAANMTWFTQNPHNQYLLIAVEGGLVAVALFLGYLTTLWNTLKYASPTEKKWGQSLFFVLVVGCCFNSWCLDSLPSHLFAVLFAMSLVCFNKRTEIHEG